MGNEADRVVRTRETRLARANADEAARADQDIYAAQCELMNAIKAEIPRALARLAAADYPHGETVAVPRLRGIGPFKTSKVKYQQKASWPVHYLFIPAKESPDPERFLLISDGYVLGPYNIPLSQQDIDKDWLSHKEGGDKGRLEAWPHRYAPSILATVLERLQHLPFTACRHCRHPIVRLNDGTWGHHQFEFPRNCRIAGHGRHHVWDDEIDASWSAEAADD